MTTQAPAKPATKPTPKAATLPAGKEPAKAVAKPAAKPVTPAIPKPANKVAAKPLPKPAAKPTEKAPAKSTKVNAANNLAGAFSHRYRYDEIKEAFVAKALFIFGPNSFGPVTGWNTEQGSPVMFDQVSKMGDPLKKPKALLAKPGAMVGIRGDYMESADHLEQGSLVYVNYEPADPEANDPEDQPGWYAAYVVKVGKAGVTVTFANVPEAGEHRYRWPDMVAAPAENA